MQYRYHETLSDKVYEITSGCEVPEGYEEDHFRKHIMCEFDPRDGRFLFGWVYDSAINMLWMSIGSTWIHYEIANSLELAKKIVGSMDYLPDDLGCSQGFGYMTELIQDGKHKFATARASQAAGAH